MIDNISSIQIIGTQRSGSNLLRLILNQFTEISAPHPPHVLRTFVPLLEHYGDLNVEANFYQLAVDIADFVNANPVAWRGVQLMPNELVQRARDNSLLSLYEMLYIIKAQQDNARIWCCKSMFNEYYANEIEAKGINPFYIYLYRDGRDVAASFKKAIVGPKHVYHIATKWKEDQERALQIKSLVGQDRFIDIKYEDLISKPEEILKALSNKLGLVYSTELLEFYKSNESKNTASSGDMWKNVARPIISNNVGKFRNELTEDEINTFENISGAMLMNLGYRLTNDRAMVSIEYSFEKISQFNNQNKALKEVVRKRASSNDLELRSKQEAVLTRIMERINQ